MNFETSLIELTSNGYNRLATFSWGMSITPKGIVKSSVLRLIQSPSSFHLNAVNGLIFR